MAKKRKRQSGWRLPLRVHVIIFLLLVSVVLLLIQSSLSHRVVSTQLCANSISCIKDLSSQAVLGDTTSNGNKHIYVDLSSQHLYAFEGNNLVYNFLISSGKWYPTPTGDFMI